jgi:hypothetical protein
MHENYAGCSSGAKCRRWPVSSSGTRHETPTLFRIELEPEVRDWLDSLSDGDYKRVDDWCRDDRTIVLLTVFRKTTQHDQRQIERAVRAQKVCERDHDGPAAATYERQA